VSFQLVTKRSFDREFAALPEQIQLRGSGFYRIRIGDYRLIYSPDTANRLVRLLAVGHRREIYRR
jgi:mRNA interferase RelE/StbE